MPPKKVRNRAILAGAAAIVLLSACATREDTALATILTAREKADILVNKGRATYNDVVANGNLGALADAQRCFETARLFDPDNEDAIQFLDDIRNFSTKARGSYVATATALLKKDKRTDAQDFELVVAVKKAATISGSDPETRKIAKDAEPVRTAFVAKRNAELADLATKITAEKNLAKIQKDLKRADVVTDEIFAVDSENAEATKNANAIESHVLNLVGGDITAAKTKLAQKKFADAESALLRAEKSLAMASDRPIPEIGTLKYQLYFDWASSLYDAKKYQSADDKASLALKAKKTGEASALRSKIAKAATARDYDAEIDDIVESVNARIADGDPAGALQIIQANAGKLKVKANIAKLDSRKSAALALRDQIYKDGIALYNDEDYDGAKQKFAIVVAVDPAYEQAQSYLDKTTTKIKALAGGN